MRLRPLVALSVAACSVALLTGCGAAGEPESSPTGSPADLCAAAAPSGAASDAITVEGEVGTKSTAVFEAPLEIDELQATVVDEGSGDPVASGDLILYALSAFNADTGEELGSLGYEDAEILPTQISPENPLGQILGCAAPGTRVVAAFPATDTNPGEVYVFDFTEVVPSAAWGAAQDALPGFPTVELDDEGAPTITIPDEEAPTAVELETLKQGDGAIVQPGDTVLVQYTGVKWSDGEVFDSSWEAGAPVSFQTTGVVDGFRQALEGYAVGSQVLVVIPPAFGYGEASADNTHELAGETLVFVVDILGLQRAVTQ